MISHPFRRETNGGIEPKAVFSTAEFSQAQDRLIT
jgi:hypothetical protein